jgi:hypothetical protein
MDTLNMKVLLEYNDMRNFLGPSEISGFRIKVDNCALIGYYAACGGNPILKGQESCPLKIKPVGCLETSVMYYHCTLHNSPEERSPLSYSCCYLCE